ncbi:MAG: SHOCT domain-containing protein [Calditrichaceae bacterium]|nr:SHOCT domain-containing protein [Calditrichia bacterium]NUQ40653.1 SHOCT domain-containing protein [Calditrichaceae bacterium]
MMDGGSGMGITWIFGWIILAIIIGLVIRGICTPRKRNSSQPEKDEAVEILKKRYARGEISEKELEHMKHELES